MRVDLRTSLIEALEVSAGSVVSIVGAGGKTSLMFALGREAGRRGWPTLLTTTTKIFYPRGDQSPAVILGPETEATIAEITQHLAGSRCVLAGRGRDDSKIVGFDPAFLDHIAAREAITIVAECDGAMGRSIKVPRPYEPPLASATDIYVVVVGADCLDQAVGSEYVFNAEGLMRLAGLGKEAKITEQVVVKTILSEDSYLGRKPAGARMCVFINKVEADVLGHRGQGTGSGVLDLAVTLKGEYGVDRVIMGELRAPREPGFLILR